MIKKDIVILGAGLTGISSAYFLKGKDFIVIEKSNSYGGLCSSVQKEGFTFDQTGHWLHMKSDVMKNLFFNLFKNDYKKINRKTFVFSNQTYTLYPFQANTFGLPSNIIKECLLGFIKAHYQGDKSKANQNFYEWCIAHFGEGISKYFMIPYNSKIYTVHPKDMASHWCDTYIPKPTLEQVVDGAVTSPNEKFGYNASFCYPQTGGIGEMVNRLFGKTETNKYMFNCEPVEIDINAKTITLNDGKSIQYNHLVSSIPLKDFLKLLKNGNDTSMSDVAKRLKIAQVSYLNIAVEGELKNEAHWIYLPEKDFMPYRVGSFSNLF